MEKKGAAEHLNTQLTAIEKGHRTGPVLLLLLSFICVCVCVSCLKREREEEHHSTYSFEGKH